MLVTYALGSCIGLAIWDPVKRVGGILHSLLPKSSLDPKKAAMQPAMFLDTGVPLLFRTCYAAGAEKKRLIVKAAGGAHIDGGPGSFQVGRRNVTMLRRILWKNGVLLAGEDLGGTLSRTLSLEIGTGRVWMKSEAGTKEL